MGECLRVCVRTEGRSRAVCLGTSASVSPVRVWVRVCVRAIENEPSWGGRLLRREVSCDKFVETHSVGLDFFKNLRSSASQENVITQIIDNDDYENNDNFPSN